MGLHGADMGAGDAPRVCTGLTRVLGMYRVFARGSAPRFVAPPSSALSVAVKPKAAAKPEAVTNLRKD